MRTSVPRPLLFVSLAGLMGGACVPEPGLNGADRAEPTTGTGPCFEANLMDGFQDGDEVLTVFACFNQYGAFDELSPMVTYLATSEDVSSLLGAMNETLVTFDVVGGLEIAARLLSSEEKPLSQAAGLFTEAVDAGLVGPGIGIAREATAEMVACEERADRGACSVPRLTLLLLDTEVPTELGVVLDGVTNGTTSEQRVAMLQSTAEVLVATSTLNADKLRPGNDVVSLGRLLLDVRTGETSSPLEQLLPYVVPLLDDDIDGDGDQDPNPDNDNLLAAVARPIAGIWRDEDRSGLNAFDYIPDELVAVFTTNSAGQNVGWDGTNVLDELLAATEDLTGDLSMLTMELTLPGESEPTTLLELVLDVLDSVYLSGEDPTELVSQMADLIEPICSEDSTVAICDLLNDALPPAQAFVELTPKTTGVLMAVVYAAHQVINVADLLPVAEILLELDLINETRGLTVAALQAGTISNLLPMIPVFIDTDLGRLTPAGQAVQSLGLTLLSEQDLDGDGEASVAATVPLDLVRALLHPAYPTADLDLLLGTLGSRMQDQESGLYPETLLNLAGTLSDAIGEVDLDLEAMTRDLLENEELWGSAIKVLADPALADLLAPVQGREGAVWYLYDLIDGGTLDEMLSLAATVLDLLVDYGVIDPGTSSAERSARAPAALSALPPVAEAP